MNSFCGETITPHAEFVTAVEELTWSSGESLSLSAESRRFDSVLLAQDDAALWVQHFGYCKWQPCSWINIKVKNKYCISIADRFLAHPHCGEHLNIL